MNRASIILIAVAAAALLPACAGKKPAARPAANTPAAHAPSGGSPGVIRVPSTGDEPPIEATSLLGVPLRRPPIDPEKRAKLESDLADALAATQLCATCCDEFVWYGRRLGYLHMYRAAVDVYARQLRAPTGVCSRVKLHRHIGHRLITLRRIDEALSHLTMAASIMEVGRIPDEVEPDGIPNARNLPRGTLHSNVYYHLGLAHYLKGDFAAAEKDYRACLGYCTNDDMRCATLHWLYMSLRRQGKHDEAASVLEPVRMDMDIIENQAYWRLCLMYKGILQPDEVLNLDSPDPNQLVSAGYGVANWYACEGQPDKARPLLEKLAADPNWPAFGVIAAEADLARAQPAHR